MLALTRFVRMCCLALAAFGHLATNASANPPQRIVSLNLCTDQILIDLVEPGRIAALSRLASDPALSATAARARELASTRGSAEEVLALDPDLVLAMQYSTPASVSLLQRLGKRVVIVPIANDLDGIRTSIHTIAAAVNADAKGAELIAEFDRHLASLAPARPPRPTALAYEANSLASGPSTLLDAMIDRAGYDNSARRRSLGPSLRLPLESLVTAPPDLLILANGANEFRSVMADNLRHPALAALIASRPTVRIEMPFWLCGTPHVAEAIERLATMRGAARP